MDETEQVEFENFKDEIKDPKKGKSRSWGETKKKT